MNMNLSMTTITFRKKHSIFISSTYEDLRQERQAVIDAALDNDIIPVGMEQFHAAPAGQWAIITKMIDECDGYLLIVGGRYGSIDDTVGISYTEKEYDYAKSKMLPVWVLIRDKSAITADKMDKDDSKHTKLEKQVLLEAFTEKVKNDGNTVAFFKDIKDLKYEAAQAFVKSSDFFPDDSGWVRYSEINNRSVKNSLMKKEVLRTTSIDEIVGGAELSITSNSVDTYGKCDSEVGKFFLSIPKYLEEKGLDYSKEGDENKDMQSYLVTKGMKFKYSKFVPTISNPKPQKIATGLEVSIAASGFSDSLSLLIELLRLYKGDSKQCIILKLNTNIRFVMSTEEASSIICSNEDFRLNKSQLNSYIYTKYGFIFSAMEDNRDDEFSSLFGGDKVSIVFDIKTATSEGIIELIKRLLEIGLIKKSRFF